MKKMKKKSFLITMSLALGLTLSSSVYADSTDPSNTTKNLHINLNNYNQEIVDDIMQDPSVSYSDAVYYAKLDMLVEEMEKQGIEFELPNGLATKSALSDEYVRINKSEFQQKVLNLEPEAVKKALTSELQLRTDGLSELQNISSKFLDQNSSVQTFTLEYPDGSRISSTVENILETDSSKFVSVFSPGEIDQINNLSNGIPYDGRITTFASSPFINGPWDSTSLISSERTYLYNSSYPTGWPSGQLIQVTTKTEWSFSSGVNYSKLNDVLQWQWYGVVSNVTPEGGTYDFSVAPVSDSGGSASYGVVSVKNEFPNHPRKSGTGTTARIQGYMDSQFEVSSSFSATWGFLGIDVNAGGQWHQYAITEVDGWTNIDKFAGTLK